MNVIGTIVLFLALFAGVALAIAFRPRVLGLALAALSGCAVLYFIWQSASRAEGYEAVHLGAAEQEVISRVGPPPRVTDGTEWVEPGYKKALSEVVPGCTKEYWYASFLWPDQLSFCFNAEGKLIHKYHWQSW